MSIYHKLLFLSNNSVISKLPLQVLRIYLFLFFRIYISFLENLGFLSFLALPAASHSKPKPDEPKAQPSITPSLSSPFNATNVSPNQKMAFHASPASPSVTAGNTSPEARGMPQQLSADKPVLSADKPVVTNGANGAQPVKKVVVPTPTPPSPTAAGGDSRKVTSGAWATSGVGVVSGTSTTPAPGQGAGVGDVRRVGSNNGVELDPKIVKYIMHKDLHYNPVSFTIPPNARFFVIKSYSEDDVHKSIKFNVWTSTKPGNERLNKAFLESTPSCPVFLFFSVNCSGHFNGVAQMMSEVDFSKSSGIWSDEKWKGEFGVKWIYVKDVPNKEFRHIRVLSNENKPVTNSRDAQAVPCEQGRQVMKIIAQYSNGSNLFLDFDYYEGEEEKFKV